MRLAGEGYESFLPPFTGYTPMGYACNTPLGYVQAMTHETRRNARSRLARIEGQVRGLVRMIDGDRYCIDVITQIQAVRAALARVERLVLQDHVGHCVADAVASGNKAERDRKIEELVTVLDRTSKS
jgi:DNA-binding FrmR family transcriptional regulator